jgi:hypothetical protein
MIEKVEMYTVVCDNCKESVFRDSDYSCYPDEGTTLEIAKDDQEMVEHEGRHYCKDCYYYTDEDIFIIKTV